MRTSPSQFELMITYMEQHGDLSKPSGNARGRMIILKSWEELTLLLNSDKSGDTKRSEKWKKVWTDFKNNTKKKAARLSRAANSTGGGPAVFAKLSDVEQRVLNMVGVQVATGSAVEEVGLPQVQGGIDVQPTERQPRTLRLSQAEFETKLSGVQSHLWSHFSGIDAERQVKCLYCQRTLSVVNKPVHSLIRHLMTKHPDIELWGETTSSPQITAGKNSDVKFLAEPTRFEESEDAGTSSDEDSQAASNIHPKSYQVNVKREPLNPTLRTFKQRHTESNLAELDQIASDVKQHIDETLVSMISLTNNKQTEALDEYDHFALMIAAKIRKIQNMEEKETVMNSIQNIVYESLMRNI